MVTTSTNNRPSVGRARRPLSVTGLSIWRGQVQEEQLKDLERLPKRMQIFRQMRRDHVIGTALEAVKSPLTAADIDVSPGGESSVDKEAADFLWSVIGDMTQPWTRHVEDALELLDFGFSLGEMVFKRREGLQGPDGPSDFDDGAIGLSYISPIGQETLGDAFEPWKLDRQGNVEAIVQRDPVTFESIEVPGWKLLHYTSGSRKRNPEGDPILASLYRPWRFRTNLEELEGIGVERDVGGTPVVYVPEGVSTDDLAKIDKMIAGLRNDEESFIRFVGGKQSEQNKDGWLIEPYAGGQKAYDVGAIIDRWDKRILMRFFNQFLMLGMDNVGTQALVQGSHDFFSLSLRKIQNYLLEVWNGQFVPMLFLLNAERFRGMTSYPKITWSDPGKPDLQELTNLYSTLRSADVLTVGEWDEDHVRNVAGLPDRPEGVGVGERVKPVPPSFGDFGDESEFAKFAEPAPAIDHPAGQRLRVRPGRVEQATNAYQRNLVQIYDTWSGRAIRAISNAQRDGLGVSQQVSILNAMLGDLEADLIQAGRLRITDAVFNSMRGPLERWRGSAPMLAALQDNLRLNEQFVSQSLMPDLQQRIAADLIDGVATDRVALRAAFERLRYRPAQYAGALNQTVMSVSINVGRADDADRRRLGMEPARIRWELDPAADHCMDDPLRGTFGCMGLAGEYQGWNAMPGAPGEITTCRSACRCVLSLWLPEIGDWHRVG